MKTTVPKRMGLVLAIALLVVLANPNGFSLAIGGVLVAIGTAVRIWASGHLNRSRELTTSGPYAYLRDPLYLGRFFLLVGFCTMGWGSDWIVLLLGLGVFFGNYMPRKRRKEMARLEGRFDEEYTRYSSQVRSLIPRLTPYPEARRKSWSFTLFWKDNREQYLLLGVVALCVILVLCSSYR